MAGAGGEGGDSLEGGFSSFSIMETFLLNVLCEEVNTLNKQRSKIMNDCKTGEGAAATKYLELVSIFLPHDVGPRRGSRRDPRQGSSRGAMERSSRG